MNNVASTSFELCELLEQLLGPAKAKATIKIIANAKEKALRDLSYDFHCVSRDGWTYATRSKHYLLSDLNYSDLKELPSKELRRYLLSLDSGSLQDLLDQGFRHKENMNYRDLLAHLLMFTRPFATATAYDSWGELEKLLAIILAEYIAVKGN